MTQTITPRPAPLPLNFSVRISREQIEKGLPKQFFYVAYLEENGINFTRFFSDLKSSKENLQKERYSICDLTFLETLPCSEQQKIAVAAQFLEIALAKRWNPNDKDESREITRIFTALSPLLTLKGEIELGRSLEQLSEKREVWLEQVITGLSRHILEPNTNPSDATQKPLNRLELMRAVASKLFPTLLEIDEVVLKRIADSETFAESFLYLIELARSHSASVKIKMLNRFFKNFPHFTSPLLLLPKFQFFCKNQDKNDGDFFDQEFFEQEDPLNLFEFLNLFSSGNNEETQASQFLDCLKMASELSGKEHSSFFAIFDKEQLEKLIKEEPENKNQLLEEFCYIVYQPYFEEWNVRISICFKLLEKKLTISRYLNFCKNINGSYGKSYKYHETETLNTLCQPGLLEKCQRFLSTLSANELEFLRFDDFLEIPESQWVNVLELALEKARSGIEYAIIFNAYRFNLPLEEAQRIWTSFPRLVDQANLAVSRRAFRCLSRLSTDHERTQFEQDCLRIWHEKEHPSFSKLLHVIYKYHANQKEKNLRQLIPLCEKQTSLLHRLYILKIGLSLPGKDISEQIESLLEFLRQNELNLDVWLEALAASTENKILPYSILNFIQTSFGKQWRVSDLTCILTACRNILARIAFEEKLPDFEKIFSYFDQTLLSEKILSAKELYKVFMRDSRCHFLIHFSTFHETVMQRTLERLPYLLNFIGKVQASNVIPLCKNICTHSEENWENGEKYIVKNIVDNFGTFSECDQKTLDKIVFEITFASLFSTTDVYHSLKLIHLLTQFAETHAAISEEWGLSMIRNFELVSEENRLRALIIGCNQLYNFPQLLPAYFTTWYQKDPTAIWVNAPLTAAEIWTRIFSFHNGLNEQAYRRIQLIMHAMQRSTHVLNLFSALYFIDDHLDNLEIRSRLSQELRPFFPPCLKIPSVQLAEDSCNLFSIVPNSAYHLIMEMFRQDSLVNNMNFSDFLIRLMSNQEIRKVVFERIEKILTSGTVPKERALTISKFVIDFHEELFLEESDPLFALCVETTIRCSPNIETDPKNPYHVFSEHQKEAKVPPIKFTPPALTGNDGESWHWNLNLIRSYMKITTYTANDLPKNVSNQTLSQLFESLENYIHQNPEQEDNLNSQIEEANGLTLLELKDNLLKHPFIKAMLSSQQQGSEPVSSSKYYLFVILEAILDQSSQRLHGKLSEQDEMLLKLSCSVQNCSTGKRDGLLNYYNLLPTQFKRIQATGISDNPSKQLAYGFVIKSIQDAMYETVRQKEFLKELTNKKEISEETHQTLFLINRFAKQIGLPAETLFDLHTHLLEDGLLTLTPEQFLAAFFKYFHLGQAHKYLCQPFDQSQQKGLYEGMIAWLKSLKGKKPKISDCFEIEEIEKNGKSSYFWKLSEQGATMLLESMFFQIKNIKRKEEFKVPYSKKIK